MMTDVLGIYQLCLLHASCIHTWMHIFFLFVHVIYLQLSTYQHHSIHVVVFVFDCKRWL